MLEILPHDKTLPMSALWAEKVAKIAVIDDDKDLLELLKVYFERRGFQATVYTAPAGALEEIEKKNFDLVLCDLWMPEMSGNDFVKALRVKNRLLPVIVMTANNTIDSAIESLNLGAFDYITKPLNLSELEVISKRAVAQSELQRKYESLREEREKDALPRYGTLIGKGDKMRELFSLMTRICDSISNVLITGESGTGKELVARTLHSKSKRFKSPFVAINCAAIPAELLEAELFGHTKGAFTGADRLRRGLFEEANGGSIFLDEIGEMPLNLQVKLLRVLQEKTVRPVGSNVTRDLDVRVIAATNKDLQKEVKEGRFREDLYYRLAVMPLHIPALRERTEDIPLLAKHFLAKFSQYSDTPRSHIVGFTDEAMAKLVSHSWPGNVRELENTVERAVILCEDNLIGSDNVRNVNENSERVSAYRDFNKLPSISDLENEYIKFVMIKTNGHREKASQILGIDRKTLYRKLNQNNNSDSGISLSGGRPEAQVSHQ
ncbi:MAG: hypothetical protein A4S09_15770 [Proteobacteria bacterium SG_bin7]|nr:MAG: hypothetical protein A4S09_15770 [Proteobacteria bacterium SG_bin7]